MGSEMCIRDRGVRLISDLRRLTVDDMKNQFGINSQHFWNLCRGIDSRAVVPDRHAKSISHETTFGTDIVDVEVLKTWIIELSDQVARRLRRYDIVGKTVNVKIRFSDFKTISRASTLAQPSNCSTELANIAADVLMSAIASDGNKKLNHGIRLLGMGVSNLRHPAAKNQLLLFGQDDKEKQQRMDRASDEIKDKFGVHAVRRASSVQHKIKHRNGPLLDE